MVSDGDVQFDLVTAPGPHHGQRLNPQRVRPRRRSSPGRFARPARIPRHGPRGALLPAAGAVRPLALLPVTAVENAAIRELAEELRGLSTKVSAAAEQAAQARAEVAELKVAVEPAVRLSSGLAAFGRAAAGTGKAIKWGAGVGSGAAGFLLVLKTFGVL